MMESSNPKSLFGDYTKMLTQFKLPGVDVAAMLESRRKDIEALAAVNTTALAGIQAFGQKQAEILSSTMAGVQSLVARRTDPESKPSPSKTERVQCAVYKTLANAQDLAGTVYKAQSDVYAVLTKRIAENVEELKARLQPNK
jgi:hypothetical protein